MEARSRRVLVVDRDEVVADTFVEILKFHGYEAAAVYSGEDAVALASTFRPFAVLLDVILPGMNGLDTAHLILGQLPRCQIILTSGSPETAALLTIAQRNGITYEVLPKPVPPEIILNALATSPSHFVAAEKAPEFADGIDRQAD